MRRYASLLGDPALPPQIADRLKFRLSSLLKWRHYWLTDNFYAHFIGTTLYAPGLRAQIFEVDKPGCMPYKRMNVGGPRFYNGVSMETPGMILKREREVRGFSLKQISAVTRIPETALEAIENNEFDAFPAEVFMKGFVRNYARELQIAGDDVMEAYDAMKLQKSRMVLEPVAVHTEFVAAPRFETESVASFHESEHVSSSSATQTAKQGFRFVYVLVALIAVASIALSMAFSGTGEAEEGDLVLPAADAAADSPFLISNTSEGWEAP